MTQHFQITTDAGIWSGKVGVEVDARTEHAYVFSLDDVRIKGSNLTDTSLANVTSSVFVSGSRASAQSTATFTLDDKPNEATTLTLKDAEGTTVIFEIDNENNGAVGSNVAVNGIAAAGGGANGTAADLVAKINGASINITATAAAGKVTLTQVTSGTKGDVAIASSFTAAALSPNGSMPTTFTGGTGDELGSSYTANNPTNGVSNLLELGFNKFQMPLCGGFDGVNIIEPDPFANRILTAGGSTPDSYAFASVDRAIELIKYPEMIEHNIAAMPGITNASLTSKLVEKCESRADSLAVIDLPDVYKPPHELKCTSFSDRLGTTPEAAAKALKARQINSSYGATYYPWVKVRDNENSRDIWVPPSVVALGVMAYTEQASEVWFAPAGFNRGGLNEGNAGIPVLQASEQLLSKQRDALYESNINPIASFVTEGLVIFGQKTLQSTPSALDRINVRRLLIFVKKEVSRIANGLLFDQNVPATWNRSLGQVNPFLQSVKTRLGLSDFKVILDNTTTTPDLVDRNVMYAKIFLKPARAIEFIAVDFVITNTGASFDD